MSNWTLFSNHGHVLVSLSRNPESRLRDVAADVGITERAVQKIVRDLQDVGMVTVTKHGRRNRYRINHQQPLRHDLEAHCTLGELVNFVSSPKPDKKSNVKSEASDPTPVHIEQVEVEPEESPRPEPSLSPPVAVSESEVTEDKPTKPENSIERQQGSLF